MHNASRLLPFFLSQKETTTSTPKTQCTSRFSPFISPFLPLGPMLYQAWLIPMCPILITLKKLILNIGAARNTEKNNVEWEDVKVRLLSRVYE